MINDEKFDEVYGGLMDAMFDLAIELQEKDEEDLTDNEAKFLDALDDYCDMCDEEEEEVE